MKKNILLILLTLSLVSCSFNQVDKESEHNKKQVVSNLNDDEQEELDKLANHEDKGVYHYITYRKDDDSVVADEIYGVDDNYQFKINSNGIYEFVDDKKSIIANTQSNLYYQTNINGNEEENQNDSSEFYNDLYQKGEFKIIKDDKYLIIKFDNGDYRKYDANSLDLVEESFTGEDMKLVRKLESYDKDVLVNYNNYIKVIDNMEQTDDIGQVTKND